MKVLYTIIILLAITGCAEMGVALSQMNQEMGATCASTYTYYAKYDAEKGKYKPGYYTGGKYAKQEKRWIDKRMRYYGLNMDFGLYYDVSPITGTKYRFDKQCIRYY